MTLEIKTLHDGLNLKDDPADPTLAEGVTTECVGFDLTVGGKLQTAKGNAIDHDLTGLLPTGSVQCCQIVFMLGTKYVLATTSGGLYSNATLVDASFTGRFRALTFGSNIYLVNGTLARRFNGTTCTRWGIAPPVVGPTITAGANIVKVIDSMEVTTSWIANAVGCVVADEAVIKKIGNHSCKITFAAAGSGSTYRVLAIDATALSDGSESPDADLFEFWLYVDDLSKLSMLRFLIDVGDGTFVNDFYSYAWPFYGADSQQITPTTGTAAEVVPEQSIEIPVSIPVPTDLAAYALDPYYYKSPKGGLAAPTTISTQITLSRANIEELFPELQTFTGQLLSLYRSANITDIKSGTWVKLQVPKSYFQRTGVGTGNWANINTVKIEVIASGAVNLYIDQVQIAGGGKLYGDYWFMYGWARVDATGNVQHYSGPARAADGTLHIQGPVTFKRQPVAYAARTVSADSQVNACVVYIIGENLTFWYVLHVIENNLAAVGSFSAGEDDCYRRMISLRNDPAPTGTDLVLHKGSIWMLGFSNYPNMIRKSDISIEGDLLLEAWPGRNAYIPTGAGGPLTSIDILNRQIVARGQDGEWVLDINDPADFSSVVQDEVVGKGCLSRDGVMKMGSSVIYPAAGAFVESNGSTRNLVLPEASPVITAGGVAEAKAVFSNYEGYFSFSDNNGQSRTAKLDLLRGQPRVAYQNNLKYDWLFLDSESAIVYGVIGGTVVRFNYDYTDRGAQLDCRLTTKSFIVPGPTPAWKRVVFQHMTNGQYLHINAFVNGVEVGHKPFKSDTRSECRFDFGPVSGGRFHFTIWGQYSQLAEIYLPIKVYVDGIAASK